MPITLYALSDGPSSLAVRQALEYLELEHELVNMDIECIEQLLPEEIAEKNPRTLPILDDNGFLLGESNAILQYLAEQYGKDDTLYPKDPKARAVVNHRLCFNLSTYYPCVAHYTLGPVILDNPKSSVDEHKMDIALDNFHALLKLLMKDYVAGDTVTIADFQLVATTMCLQFAKVNLRRWPLVKNWYNSYKFAHPTLWKIVEAGMKELDGFRAPSEKKEEHKPLSHLLLPLPN